VKAKKRLDTFNFSEGKGKFHTANSKHRQRVHRIGTDLLLEKAKQRFILRKTKFGQKDNM
jgi:hypothetical protein